MALQAPPAGGVKPGLRSSLRVPVASRASPSGSRPPSASDTSPQDLARSPISLPRLSRTGVGRPLSGGARGQVDPAVEAQTLSIFKRFDSNGDGRIYLEDLEFVFTRLDPDLWTKERVSMLFKEMDVFGDNQVSYEEFLRWIMSQGKDSASAEQAFHVEGIKKIKEAVIFDRREVVATSKSFEACIDLDQNDKLGIKVEPSEETDQGGSNINLKVLLVTDVVDSGAVAMYNSENYPKIQPGDKISLVNGHSDVAGMKLELRKALRLQLVVRPAIATQSFRYHLSQFYHRGDKPFAEGLFASIYRARHRKSNEQYAVKSVSKHHVCSECAGTGRWSADPLKPCQLCNGQKTILSIDAATFDHWLQNMKDLDHPNIIKLFDIFEDWRAYHLVLEYCRGGELFEYLLEEERLSEIGAGVIIKQVLEGVLYMHGKYICHGDIKPDSILLMEHPHDCGEKHVVVKLIDFRTARQFQAGSLWRGRVSEAAYTAPEICRGPYDHRCDAWSVGIVLYLCMCGYEPFQGDTDEAVLRRIVRDQVVFAPEDWRLISQDCRDLVSQLLDKNVGSRLSPAASLTHRWFAQARVKDPIRVQAPRPGRRMARTQTRRRLQKVAVSALSERFSPQELHKLQLSLQKLDVKGDGTITQRELKESFEQLGTAIPSDQLAQMIQCAEQTGEARVNYKEFLAAALSKQFTGDVGRLRAAFSSFDKDGSGYIDRAELEELLAQSASLDKPLIDEVLKKWDGSHDGVIDFEEFQEMMHSENYL